MHNTMDEEDEFGDLYADILVENSGLNSSNPPVALASKPIYHDFNEGNDDENDEEVLYGKPSSSSIGKPSSSPASSQQQQQQKELSISSQPSRREEKEITKDDEEEVVGEFDFGGVGHDDGNEQDVASVKAEMESDYFQGGEIGDHTQGSLHDDFLATDKRDELDAENGENQAQQALDRGDQDSACDNNRIQFSVEADVSTQVNDDSYIPGIDNNSIPGIGLASGAATSLTGISTGFPGYHEDGGGVNGDDFGEKGSERQQELRASGEMVGTPNQDLQEGDEWDSDSDDDLQIVLNDDRAMYGNLERGERDFEEGSEDEDGDDLVIVADSDPPLEEQEWGGDTQLPLEGVVSTSGDKVLGADKAGDDRGQIGKGNIAIGNGALSRVGYSGQHFHPHYSQYKYVRPGATAISGGIPSTSGGVQIRPSSTSVGIWGPGKGVPPSGRGDWMAGVGRGSMQRTSLGSGMLPWGNVPGGRGYLNGFEFTLPPSKMIFEIDIDSFEEKPWKQPGMDITDFFNFNLDEDGWKQYCKQLEQLRLEATMQSKIRVYESGRSEQEYDPDLPPELAAAAGLPEAYGENTQNKQSDGGSSAVGRGRGSGRGRVSIPTGRAIQVEGGGFERRPSADFRRPRFHDSDAVIEIVLQDVSTDNAADPCRAPESANDVNEKEDSGKGEQEFVGDEKGVNTVCFMQTHHTDSWERDNDDRKIGSGGGSAHRSLHHGDGILPLPPGPPIHCPPGSGVGHAIFSASILDQQHVSRRMRIMKPKGFPQQGHEKDNGIVANQGVRGSRADNWHKGGNGVERTRTPEVGQTRDDIERKPTPEVRSINLEQHAMEDVTVDSRSDGQSKPNSEVKGEEDTTDDHGSVYSMKGLKMNSHGSPIPAVGYARFKASKSGNSKAESGNSRGYSKDRGNSRDYTRGRGSGEDEIMQYRPQKRLAKDGNNHQFDEDSYHYQEYPWNSRHNDEKDSRHQKSREYLNHHGDDLYLHGDQGEDVYARRIKDERIDRQRERDEHIKPWQGKNEDLRSLREKDDEMWRRDFLSKDGGLQHRDRRQNTERDERKQHLHPRKRKDGDDLRAQLDRDFAKRREKDDVVDGRLEKGDDPYIRRKRDEDLRWKERVDKEETSRDIREREDMGGEKHDKADDYQRRKEEDLRRRERFDRDQSVRDMRDREDVGREKNERDGEYLRRKDEDTKKKERSDKDQGMREIRDRDDMHREKYERDDEHLRRKEEELYKKERADKDEGVRDPREREDITREKSERDDDHHFRRREEDSRRRNMFDDSRSRKQRDDSWRRKDKEDENLRKPGFDETHGRREREEDKSILAGRSRRHSEEKLWHGSGRERGRSREEASLSSIDKDRLKEKRRYEEPRAKVKDRVDEIARSRHHERDEMYSRIDRSSRLDRSHLRYDHSGSGHSLEDQKLYREKRTLDHRNGLASGLVDDRVRQDQAVSKRRKTEDHYSSNHEKRALDRGTEDPDSGGAWTGHSDRRGHSRMTPSELPKRMHEQEGSDRNNPKLKQPADDSVSEDEHVKRGRSKLERWTSHKEREDARVWENDASKHKKLSSNHEEPTNRKDEEPKMESSSGPEAKQKPGNECLQSREGGDHVAEREHKDSVSDGPVHIAEGALPETDKGGSQQHSEVVAKLEKRRERFKQPIQNEKDSQKKSENEIALENEMDEVKHERPARKRRWGSN